MADSDLRSGSVWTRLVLYFWTVLRLGWTGRVGLVVGAAVAATGLTATTAVAFLSEKPLLATTLGLAIFLAVALVGGYRAWSTAEQELRRAEQTAADDFRDFAERFAGWLRSREITAPPDMTPVLGENYEDEQRRALEAGEISWDRYQVLVQDFTERKEWTRQLRAEYQRDWRADVKRQFTWADKAGKMESKDYLVQLYLNGFYEPVQITKIAETFQRIASRL